MLLPRHPPDTQESTPFENGPLEADVLSQRKPSCASPQTRPSPQRTLLKFYMPQ